jgi:hypothetical protein
MALAMFPELLVVDMDTIFESKVKALPILPQLPLRHYPLLLPPLNACCN